MVFSDIRICEVEGGWLRNSRCLLETFDENNDKKPDNSGGFGIRCHDGIVAIVLGWLGKIEAIAVDSGKTIYLNKGSFQKWRERHWKEMIPGYYAELPTAEQIVNYRKAEQKTRLEVREGIKGRLAMTALQEGVTAVFPETNLLFNISRAINQLNEVIKAYEEGNYEEVGRIAATMAGGALLFAYGGPVAGVAFSTFKVYCLAKLCYDSRALFSVECEEEAVRDEMMMKRQIKGLTNGSSAV